MSFSRDGKVLATTSDDGSVDVWDVPTASLRETFTGHAAAAAGPVFSPDGATLYTASGDGSVIAWDVRGKRRLGRPFRFAPVAQGGEGVHAPPQVVAGAVAVSPDSSLFVTSPGPKRVTLWRARDVAVVGELRGPVTGLQSLAWSHDGRLVAATGNGGDTVVWDVRTRKIVKLLGPGGPGGTVGVNFSADDRLLGTAGQDGTVRLYDVAHRRAHCDAEVEAQEGNMPDSIWPLHASGSRLQLRRPAGRGRRPRRRHLDLGSGPADARTNDPPP